MTSLANAEASIYDFTPVKYFISCRLGDILLNLSVCAETFYTTGRKAIVYVEGKHLKYGLEKTYHDTYPIFSSQIWMKAYKPFKNETYDVVLYEGIGKSPYIDTGSWYEIFKSVYAIEWGKHPWIIVPVREEYKNIIFIHSSTTRSHTKTDLRLLIQTMPQYQFVFISDIEEEYVHFSMRTGLQIPFYKVQSFTDLAIAINSCHIFMGNLSMPNALADALHKKRITMLCGWPDDKRNINMGHIWPMQSHLFNS